MTIGVYIPKLEPLWGSDRAKTHVPYGVSHSGSRGIASWSYMEGVQVPLYVPQSGFGESKPRKFLGQPQHPQPIGFTSSCGDIHHPQDRIAQLVEQRTFNP